MQALRFQFLEPTQSHIFSQVWIITIVQPEQVALIDVYSTIGYP